MNKDDFLQLAQKIKDNTISDTEKLSLLKFLNSEIEMLSQVFGDFKKELE